MDISKDIKKRKSQTLSLADIKESFKKTELTELDQIKKNLEQKKRQKLGLLDDDPNDSDFKGEESQQDNEQEGQNDKDKQKQEGRNLFQTPIK